VTASPLVAFYEALLTQEYEVGLVEEAWAMTARCEEGGHNDPVFGFYGITPGSWLAYGGGSFAPVAGAASQAQQVEVAVRISPTPPDQGRCSGGW